MYISELQGDVLQGPRLHDLGDRSGGHSVGDDHDKAHMGLCTGTDAQDTYLAILEDVPETICDMS